MRLGPCHAPRFRYPHQIATDGILHLFPKTLLLCSKLREIDFALSHENLAHRKGPKNCRNRFDLIYSKLGIIYFATFAAQKRALRKQTSARRKRGLTAFPKPRHLKRLKSIRVQSVDRHGHLGCARGRQPRVAQCNPFQDEIASAAHAGNGVAPTSQTLGASGFVKSGQETLLSFPQSYERRRIGPKPRRESRQVRRA